MSAAHERGDGVPSAEGTRKQRIFKAQVGMLYGNASSGFAVTVVATLLLALFQRGAVEDRTILVWLGYMAVTLAARLMLFHRYKRASPTEGYEQDVRWGAAFAVGAGLAALGWGAAGILLYPEDRLLNQVFLIFVIGGMMLGGASLLAARPEAFLSFLLPTGLLPSIRLAADGDTEHLSMAALGAIFTAATLASTWRLYRTIESSLNLQFENRELVENLRIAKTKADKLNEELESRVRERTAELGQSNELLRSEIEQRERMEDELLRVRNLESLGVLAGGIAHDFNNFLTIVLGNVELARMRLDLDSPAQELLAQTSSACEKATFLSSQLLTFAKGGAPVRQVVGLERVINDSVQLARTGAAVSIDVEIAKDLWAAEVDAGQISQVLHNILLNAKQAMPSGGIIEVRATNIILNGLDAPGSGTYVRISIKDYGLGIAPEHLHRIFDPYFTTRQSGSGLGLATAYAIVRKHGGRLTAESKPGEGALFLVDLPASPAALVTEPVQDDRRLRSGSGRLLVMDDQEALRTMLARVLGSLGYDVTCARDGAEAIALYEAAMESGRSFDAALLDLTVSGGMGGLEAAAKLRELNPKAKLVVSSGYSDATVLSNFGDHGFDDVLPKPWTIPQLSEVFKRVLVGGRGRRAGQSS